MELLSKYKAYLERRDQEIDGHLSKTQNEAVLRRLVQHKHKDHLVDAQQGDKAQCGLGQPKTEKMRANMEEAGSCGLASGLFSETQHIDIAIDNTWLPQTFHFT